MNEKVEELMQVVDGRTINLTTSEMKRIIDAVEKTLEWIETDELFKEIPEEIVNEMKQEYKDLGSKISTVLEEQFEILREGRKKISEEFKNQ